MSNTLALCVVGKNQSEVQLWLAAHDLSIVDELVVVSNDNGRYGGYGHVCQRALDGTSSTVFGICHADTLFRGPALQVFRDVTAVGNVTGMVGRTMDSQYHWSRDGGIHSPSCLDGCAVFFRRDMGLRFDVQLFDGFHCAGEDVVLAARSRGIPIVIPHADAEHTSTSNFPPGGDHRQGHPPWLTDYYMYVDRLRNKYPKLEFLVS